MQGEPDVSPFTQIYQYSTKADGEIFIKSTTMIQDRLNRNLKININEALSVYSTFIVSELRGNKSIEQIQKNTYGLLRPEQVMIGVPETLRKVSFEVTLDESTNLIVLNTPIQLFNYVLKST